MQRRHQTPHHALGLMLIWLFLSMTYAQVEVTPPETTPDLELQHATVRYLSDLDLLVFELQVNGNAGHTVPHAHGALDGAPVLGYIFPTTLAPTAAGFGDVEGILALAVTSHPDFDDTPLWDEQGDGSYDNDGETFHTHWVVLEPDERVPGGLAVKEFAHDATVTLPGTNPGMTMHIDSPGFTVLQQGDTLRVLVPAGRIQHQHDFTFDTVTAYMQVNTSDENRPMLGVYNVYSVLSGDLSLPYNVTQE